MQKELIISTTSQETKIAILEDDELVEFYIERHRSQGIVGNIYKGKVTKVLPGMQSAFVDIGLERDAFLYVSDFFEDTEEYDKIVSTVEEEVAQLQETAGRVTAPTPPAAPPQVTVAAAAPPQAESPVESSASPVILPGETISGTGEGSRPPAPAGGSEDFGRGRRRDRDRDRDRERGRDRRGKKPNIPSFESKAYESPKPDDRVYSDSFEALPGESLSRLRRQEPETPVSEDPD